MKKIKAQEALYGVSTLFEIIVGIVLLVALFTSLIGLVRDISPAQLMQDPNQFSNFLSIAATLVIGVEFVKMLCNHTMGAVLEIMLLAIARQMIVEHTTPVENLIAVISVAILYMVRKFLFIPTLDRVRMRSLFKDFWKKQKENDIVDVPVTEKNIIPNPMDELID